MTPPLENEALQKAPPFIVKTTVIHLSPVRYRHGEHRTVASCSVFPRILKKAALGVWS